MRIAGTILILTTAVAMASPWQMLIARKKSNADAGGGSVTATLVSSGSDGENTSPEANVTWSAQSLGDADADRIILLGVGYRAAAAGQCGAGRPITTPTSRATMQLQTVGRSC